MLEVEQHLEGALGRAQRLERRVDEALGFSVDQRHVAVEPVLDDLPLVAMLDVEHVERRLKSTAVASIDRSTSFVKYGGSVPSKAIELFQIKPSSPPSVLTAISR